MTAYERLQHLAHNVRGGATTSLNFIMPADLALRTNPQTSSFGTSPLAMVEG
jgi:hypothetical protein